ncbi:MAG: hypothetical protein M3N41_04505, partial [Acidobacteriota bacterium]|nr:hypothetical protein [Acidobacteriota bacterium]
ATPCAVAAKSAPGTTTAKAPTYAASTHTAASGKSTTATPSSTAGAAAPTVLGKRRRNQSRGKQSGEKS